MPLKPPPKTNWLDLEHIWLPYTQMQGTSLPLPVARTEGTSITLENGDKLIDGIASWWSACHGYNHPHIIAAMQEQLEKMPHVMFGGLGHKPAYTLAKRLAALTGMPKVFFSDSGSTSVEVALKLAVQYWLNKGVKNKDRFMAFRGGYHGDTMGAMSVSDSEDGMHSLFSHYMPMQYLVDLPVDEYGFAEFEAVLKDNKKNIAALVMEPLVQGAGGMRFHAPDIVAEIHRLCKEHDVLFIADEVATGFGRTGTMFACEQAGITPDIMCLGKGLTGGTMTLAATLATKEISDAFLSDDLEKAFMHGPTFMANPLACSAANASLDLFETEPRLEQIQAIEIQLWDGLKELQSLEVVEDIRVLGAIGVVELNIEIDHKMRDQLRQKFIDEGCWIRPLSNIIYLMPSFTITEKDLSQLITAIVKVTQSMTKQL